jgi:hypothetical protein
MGNPASHLEFKHTCPSCNRTVRPGYKFCEFCGTRIPSLSTCSRCGTQFIHPKKFCDLCGAPFILEEIPGPDADEIQEPDVEEIPGTADEETPEQYDDEIPEPDTDELLEQYGEEYGDDETLESFHTQKPTSSIHHEAKKPVTVPALQRRGSSDAVDDALFLPDTEPVPAKPPLTKIRIIGGGIVLITILAAVFFIGLPMLTGNGGFSANSNPTGTEITPVPEPTISSTTSPTLTVTRTPVSGAFAPLPTQTIPTNQKYYFQVQKNPVTSKISVIFAGSAGVGSVSSADIRVTHADGSVTTGVILPLKGVNEITLAGSKETDRVEIITKMSSGETYRVYDDLVPGIR